MGQRSDFTIRSKPNIWLSLSNEYRIFGRTWPKVVSAAQMEIQGDF